MLMLNIEQGSPEWYAARTGIPTASNFDKLITSSGDPSKQRQKYLYQLAGERITGVAEETYKNGTMQRGSELEKSARELYELVNDVPVVQVGICYADKDKKFSCSPDGLIGDDGVIEIKCPLISTHVSYLLEQKLPTDYFQQVQGGLYIAGREWCDFVSFYPGLKPLIVRVKRDEKFIEKLSEALDAFCDELGKVTERIR